MFYFYTNIKFKKYKIARNTIKQYIFVLFVCFCLSLNKTSYFSTVLNLKQTIFYVKPYSYKYKIYLTTIVI